MPYSPISQSVCPSSRKTLLIFLRTAGERPVAVLNHNRPAFYMVTPKLFEAIIEEIADRDMTDLVRHRLKQKDKAIEVDIDAI